MQTPKASVSLADLAAAGIRLRPEEAAGLVRELALQAARGEVAGVPSAHVIRLSSNGRISIEGPVAAGGPSVVRAAQLLDSLLQPGDGESRARVPGGLKLVLARGLRTLDLPPFGSLAEFADALARFAAADPRAVVSGLVERWAAAIAARPEEEAAQDIEPEWSQAAQVEPFAPVENAPVRTPAPPPVNLTISDIRRARRATGMSLAQVADRSRIPLALLRQLEWGYLLNWPPDPHGRRLLARYARAAGLDGQLVIATVAPLITQIASLRALFAPRPAASSESAAASSSLADIPLQGTVAIAGRGRMEPRMRRAGGWALIAASMLLIAGLAPAWWTLSQDTLDGVPSVAHGEAQSGASTLEMHRPLARAETEARADQPAAPGVQPPAGSEAHTAGARVPAPPQRTAASAPDASPGIDRNADGRRASVPPTPPDVQSASMLSPSPSALAPASVGTAMFYAPDAAELAVVGSSGTRPGSSILRVTRIVGDSANNSHVRPSPDGRHIAFDSDRDGERGVYVADASGQNVRRVSPGGFAAMPSWSPDGRTLAFVRGETGRPDVWNLWALELETGALRQITRHTQGQPQGGSWFPSGDRIVYSLGDQLVIHDLQSREERVFSSPRRGRLVRSPVVSPDGRRVAFQVQRDGMWLLDMATGSMRRVLDDPTADEYAWSPDGRQLAYHSARSGGWNVWVIAPRN